MRRLALGVALTGAAAPALAHTGERGFVMLLPTGLYLTGGALAVLLSFVVMGLLPSGLLRISVRTARHREPVPYVGIFSFLFLAMLLACGWAGSRDPLDNPLPLTVWTLWWVGFTFLNALLGDLWRHLHPWRVLPLREGRPWKAGYWPAVALFLAFAWLELIYPAPQDPAILASIVAAYFVFTALALMAFGKAWLEHGEAFSVFFRTVSRLAPPWRRLMAGEVLPAGLVAFVLLVLATVSFDGLSRTFWWLGLIGENPLEHPGRSAVMLPNTLGLLCTFLVFVLGYGITGKLGAALIGSRDAGYGYYVLSIVPIAFGYHFAHYFPAFLVDAQYALRAFSDPLERGWDLFGTRDLHVRTSFLADHASVTVIWNVQVAAIVAAHVAAVFVAHALALRRHGAARTALVSQVPMTGLMIGYTVLGLWLLSTPVAG
ncbi:MAG TPA: hypothetical protein VG873_06355 [Burkholderiales bacterium]|nr:hypothetical protein [Burkholderiales bacterium]